MARKSLRQLSTQSLFAEDSLPIKESKSRPWMLSVGQYLDAINLILKDEKVFVTGEVVEYRSFGQWTSFALKDKADGSVLPCFLSSWIYKKSGILLEDGMEIKVSGAGRIYKPRGSFSFQVETIEPLGEGSLRKAYELLYKQLESEGLFTRKRIIPRFIERVGVISSRDGVVIHDLLKNLKALNYKIDFMNSRVEGADAVFQLVDSIRWFNNHGGNLDVLVIIRGGGSLESLQAFNNELVAREIFASKVPIIVGIGHEINVPIACVVADYSASTPTAVANFINGSWDNLAIALSDFRVRIIIRFENKLLALEDRSTFLMDKMVGHLKDVFQSFRVLSQRITVRAVKIVEDSLIEKLELVKRIERMVTIASPLRNLKLGYSIITGSGGRVIKDISQLKTGESIRSKLAQGEIISTVEKLNK